MFGLKTKLCCDKKELNFTLFEKYDIILLTESKMGDLDDILIPGFKLFTKNRLFKRKAAGGVAALVSEKISNNVTNLNAKQQDSIWLKYKCGNEINDMIICLAYISPENSIYS